MDTHTEAYTTISDVRGVIALAFTRNGLDPDKYMWQVSVEFTPQLKTSMGNAHLRKNHIKLNANLWPRATPTERYETTIHEACHLVAYILHGERGHGRAWITCMERCGVQPERCHAVNVEGLSRREKRYPVECACQTHMLTMRKIRSMVGGRHRTCKRCHTRLVVPQAA